MSGINLDREINFQGASMRHFKKGEKHVTRFCETEVLIIMFRGILRFTENEEEYELYPGEYFIQKADCFQSASKESDEPEYFYMHLNAFWGENEEFILQRRGKFDIEIIKPLIDSLDKYCHENYSYTEKLSKFFEILSLLYKHARTENEIARSIRKYIESKYLDNITLNELSFEFNFSKNHIINIFKAEYKMTPIEYLDYFKLKKCEYLLEVTSESIENISYNCGFNNYSQFYRLFVRKNNMTPREYRLSKSLK